jgi:3-hydroxybutyryl-CoA dehydrogenase
VEVVPNEATSPEVVETVKAVLGGLRKRVVVLKRDVLGFIGNRLQFAMMREAFSLVERGIASPEDVDTVVKNSIGRRLDVLGPFEIADFAGLDVWDSILGYLAEDLDRSTTSPKILADIVKQGNVGVKSGRGFREWSVERAEALRETRDRELLRWLSVDRAAGG